MSKKQTGKNIFWACPLMTLATLVVMARPSTANNIEVTCDTEDSIPMVRAGFLENNSAKDITVLKFPSEYFSSSEAVQNCQDTASRLQSLYDAGNGNYLATEEIDGKLAICAVQRRGTGCDHYSAQLLFTLNQVDDPSQALYNMLGSDLKQSTPRNSRTLGRIYTDIQPSFWQRLWSR